MDLAIYSKQLEGLLEMYAQMQNQSQHNDLSDLPKTDRQSLVTSSIAAIHRITGENSTYNKEIKRIQTISPNFHFYISGIMGVVKGLKYDIDNGFLQSLIELIHGDVFSNFLEMASHLVENGYKDAGAVIAGSTLENHLKQLAVKNGIATNDENGKPKKASTINVELAKANVYEKLDSKNVTAWLDLRNKAAHGNYGEYNREQVSLLILSIQNFITRKPA